MHIPTNDEWAAMWACPELWSAYWRGVLADVDAEHKSTIMDLLRSCQHVRSSEQPGGRVFMHRAWRQMATATPSEIGHRSFVLISEDGRCRLATTKQDIRVIGAYVASLAAKSNAVVYEILPQKRDLQFSTSTVANKPVDAQLKFTRGRSTSAGAGALI